MFCLAKRCLAIAAACSMSVSWALADTVTAMEYYIDTDPGVGSGTPMSAQDGSYNSTTETGVASVSTTGLKIGPHMVYVRARKSNGVWGTFPPQLLYVYQRTGVEEAEYYIDTDPGQGNGIPLSAVDGWFDWIDERITVAVSASGLSVGDHVLYVRAKNTAGLWGTVRAMPFEVVAPVTVSAAECGVGGSSDTQPTMGTFAMQPVDFSWGSTSEDVRKNGVTAPTPEGTYRAFVRAKNDRDMWGPWNYTTFEVDPTPYPSWIASYGVTGSDSVRMADFDGDGIPNVLEYAFNMHPNQMDNENLVPGTGTKGMPYWEVDGSLLSVEYLRRKDDSSLTYTVKFTGDLIDESWDPATETPVATPIDATWDRVQVQDAPVHGSASQRFGNVWVDW